MSNATASKELQRAFLHDGIYFQKLGERLQFYPHDPATVDECFRTALWRAPANSSTFLLYARYLSTRSCCTDRVEPLVKESIRRSASTMEDYPAAVKLLVDTGNKTEGLQYLKQYLKRDAIVPPSLFASFSTDDLLQIMPRKQEPLFHYCYYLNHAGKEQDAKKVLAEIVALPLEPPQRFSAAQLALWAGDVEMARNQARLSMSSSELRPRALKMLAQIASQGRNRNDYDAALNEIENFYVQSGKSDEACQFAAQKANVIKNPEELREAFSRIIKKYPGCALAYAKMSELIEAQSPSLSLMYLEKSVELNPEEFRFSNRLAHIYIRMQKFERAEEIYNRFLNSPAASTSAYIELARCKQSQNQNSEAIRVLQEGGAKNEKSQALWLELADTYRKFGQLTLAKREYEHVLEIDSENSYAQKALSSLNRND